METSDIRRAVLRSLIHRDFDGVARQFALHIKMPDGQINDMLSNPPRKSFGERVARKIESAYPLPPGYLDNLANAASGAAPPSEIRESEPAPYIRPPKLSAQALAVGSYYDRLPDLQKADFEAALIQILLQLPVENRTELAKILNIFR